ncbi:SLC13 family permease [Enterovirga sp. GCM10030262]|uniref:SLC13 family permease n=1 Tax=Enterovirga sp. GCM10030262 TaxID=3273391 RepID=UPI0036197561
MTAIDAYIQAHQAAIGLVILGLMFAGFLTERFPAAVVAILGTCVFLVLGILDEDGLMTALANPAPYTIGAMFVLSGALLRTGAIDAIASKIVERAGKHPRLATAELFLGAFVASAFMNNTPVVMVLIPIMARLAHATGTSAKRLLIPLSFVAILGGTMTLIGTSTNLIVDAVARDEGLPAFGIFEIAPYGIVTAATGALVMVLFGRWLLPEGDPETLYRSEEHTQFLTELAVPPGSSVIGRQIGTIPALRRARTKVIALKRGGRIIRHELPEYAITAGDHIVIRTDVVELMSMRNSRQFEVGLGAANAPPANSETVVEATIAPSHPSLGRRLADIPFLSRVRVRILGVSRHDHVPGPDLPNARMRAADRLLVTGSDDAIRRMYENPGLLGVGQTRTRAFRRHRAPIAIAALVAVVSLAALDILPILTAALLAVGAILVARCIDAEEAWGSVDGNVLILIFAMLAVGAALEQSGSVAMVVSKLGPTLESVPPWALVFVVYGLCVLMTELITNNAVAVLVTPLVIAIARDLAVDPRPLVIAVMFAASASFATPIGYQTNTLVYAAGNYRFLDFIRFGGLVTIFVGPMTCLAILAFYPN